MTDIKLTVVIPMAGYGTRVRPHTWSKPKPLMQVAGKTVLDHVLDVVATATDLKNCRLAFIIGYLGEQVIDYMAAHYPEVETSYYRQEEMLGQTHAIAMARQVISGPTMVLFSDTIVRDDLSFLLQPGQNADAIVWVKQVEDPRRFGVVSLDGDGLVQDIIEKPATIENDLAVVGYYYFACGEDLITAIDRQLNDRMVTKGEYFIADALKLMIESGLKLTTKPVDVWLDAGLPDTVLETNRHLLAARLEEDGSQMRNNGVKVIPPVFIDPSADVTASVIGPNVTIGPGCQVSYSKIEDSILEAGAVVETSQLHASLIGERSVVIGGRGRLDLGDDCLVESC